MNSVKTFRLKDNLRNVQSSPLQHQYYARRPMLQILNFSNHAFLGMDEKYSFITLSISNSKRKRGPRKYFFRLKSSPKSQLCGYSIPSAVHLYTKVNLSILLHEKMNHE